MLHRVHVAESTVKYGSPDEDSFSKWVRFSWIDRDNTPKNIMLSTRNYPWSWLLPLCDFYSRGLPTPHHTSRRLSSAVHLLDPKKMVYRFSKKFIVIFLELSVSDLHEGDPRIMVPAESSPPSPGKLYGMPSFYNISISVLPKLYGIRLPCYVLAISFNQHPRGGLVI